jgi:glycosyltransferase involved in cell wall biosynthesis
MLFNKYIFPIVSFLLHKLEKYLLKKCDSFMVESMYTKNILINEYFINKSKININPAGVDNTHFYPAKNLIFREKIDFGKSNVFLTVRRLEKRMGIDILIDACNILRKTNQDFVLLIGGQGIHKDYLQSLVDNFKLNSNVKLLGFIPENNLNNYLSNADLFILPSRDLEGFGLVVLESMASGTPILVSPEGGPPEVVRLFDNDLVLEELSPEAIADKLNYLINSKKLNFSYSSQCVDFVKNYSWQKYSDNYLKWFLNDKVLENE